MDAANNKQQAKRTIFVGGISAATSEQALFEHFSGFAEVSKVQVMRHKKKSMPKGFAYITLASAEAVARVLQASHVIDERRLDCQLAANKKEKQATKENQMKCTVFVSNLPPALSSDALQARFGQLGAVRNAYVIFDSDTRESKRVGYVQFADEASARAVLEAEVEIEGRTASCVLYKHRFCKKTSSSSPHLSSLDNTSIDFQGRDEPDEPLCGRSGLPSRQQALAASREAGRTSPSANDPLRRGYLAASARLDQAERNYRFNCTWSCAAAGGKSGLSRWLSYYGGSLSTPSTQRLRPVPEKSSWSRPSGLSFFSPHASELLQTLTDYNHHFPRATETEKNSYFY